MGDTDQRTVKIAEYSKTSQAFVRTPANTLLETVSVVLQLDPKIVDTLQNVSAYTTLENSQKFYDYCSYYETTEDGIIHDRLVRFIGAVLDTTPYDLTINSNSSSVFDFDVNNQLITIKASVFTGRLSTDALITLTDSSIVGYYTDSTGTSGYLTVNATTGSTVAIYDQNGARVNYTANVTEPINLFIATGVVGNYVIKNRKYGQQDYQYSQIVTGGGFLNVSPALIPDITITEQTLATVIAYTELNNPDMIYDYSAYYATTS